MISKALIDYKISYEEYETVIMKKKNTKKMKEDIRMIKSEKIDTWKNEINEEKGRKIETNKNNGENNGNA